jgi:hypothetical protein
MLNSVSQTVRKGAEILNQDLDSLALIRDLSSDEFERFRTVVQTLCSKTFIIRGIDKERELYDFTIRNIALFETWFSCRNAALIRDESLGVIAFCGPANTRFSFPKDEICAVLVLRLIYEEKRLEVTLTKFPAISVRDFQGKFNAMTGDEIKKTALQKVLSRLSSCKLISVESHDYTDPEAIIQMYPRIPMSIDRNALDEALKVLEIKDNADKSASEEQEDES